MIKLSAPREVYLFIGDTRTAFTYWRPLIRPDVDAELLTTPDGAADGRPTTFAVVFFQLLSWCRGLLATFTTSAPPQHLVMVCLLDVDQHESYMYLSWVSHLQLFTLFRHFSQTLQEGVQIRNANIRSGCRVTAFATGNVWNTQRVVKHLSIGEAGSMQSLATIQSSGAELVVNVRPLRCFIAFKPSLSRLRRCFGSVSKPLVLWWPFDITRCVDLATVYI